MGYNVSIVKIVFVTPTPDCQFEIYLAEDPYVTAELTDGVKTHTETRHMGARTYWLLNYADMDMGEFVSITVVAKNKGGKKLGEDEVLGHRNPCWKPGPEPTPEPTPGPTPVATTVSTPTFGIRMCPTPNTLELADGWYDLYGKNVQVKTENGNSVVWFMLPTDKFKEDVIEEVHNGLFKVSIKVNKNPATDEISGYGCELITAGNPGVTPTDVPFAGDCDNVMEGAITCDQEVKAVVLAYCVGNPDPALTISGVEFEQVVRGVVVVNGNPVTRVEFWEGNNVVNGKWVYNNIQVGDLVQIHVRFVGLTETYNVPVVEGHACGNPYISANYAENGGFWIFPGQEPSGLSEFLGISPEEASAFWAKAHLNTQLGIETPLS